MIVLKTFSDVKTRQLVQRLKFSNGQKLSVFGGINPDTRQMYALAKLGINLIKGRVFRNLGSDDSPMKPLTKRYAIAKSKAGKGNKRNLIFSGDMLDNLTVRSVSATQARMDITSRKQRVKARSNEVKSAWFGWSPRDLAELTAAAGSFFRDGVSQVGFGSGRGRSFGSAQKWLDPRGYMRSNASVTGGLNA